MFLSIIIPVYNAEKYIVQCLESCFEQDLSMDDYEVICVNDGSTDNSLALLREYASSRSNMIVIDQPNQGVSSARNQGIKQARAEYIWFVDSDDIIKPNCLQMLKNEAEENSEIISFGGYSFTECLTANEQKLFNENRLISNISYWGYVFVHLFKRSVLVENYVQFNSEIAYGEDELFFINVWENCSRRKTIASVCYLYRGHENSAMNQLRFKKSQLKRLDSVVRSMIILKKGLETGKYTKQKAIDFLMGKYKLLPYLFATQDKQNRIYYFSILRKNGIFSREFVEKYGFPGEWHFMYVYRKERICDAVIASVKKILPKHVILKLKSFMKKG